MDKEKQRKNIFNYLMANETTLVAAANMINSWGGKIYDLYDCETFEEKVECCKIYIGSVIFYLECIWRHKDSNAEYLEVWGFDEDDGNLELMLTELIEAK
jgi:hypothetical protein